MHDAILKSFIEKFNKDKEEFNRKFEDINRKINSIDKKFEHFDERMELINSRCSDIEDAFDRFGDFAGKLDDVNILLSSIETKLNQYKTLYMQGSKIHNGEIYTLKIKLQKVKPIINWENDENLSFKFKEIENRFLELEENLNKIVI